MSPETHTPQTAPFRWENVPVLAYKEEGGTHFRHITRQVLFDDGDPAGSQVRYFEIAPGGHSTLERHEHVHSVMVLRGRGQALVGRQIHALAVNDLVRVPPRTWHQFRATADEPLGFLCVVRSERDKPQRPTAGELAALRADARVGPFVRA
jgi:mannose-6-phosphate isomerase-like protein (cupin superfamily)